jgi:hypothetical protein
LGIKPNGVFTPGGENTIGSFLVAGRFDLDEGGPDGILVIDIDKNHPQKNDLLYVDKFSNFRGSFHFNNIGATPLVAGDSFLIYTNNFGFPNTPESSVNFLGKTVPAAPGVGLQWYYGEAPDYALLKQFGTIMVTNAPLDPPTMVVTTEGGTNQTFSWPESHLGYQLQVQTNSLDAGLSTNWYPVVGTENVTATNLPIDPANPTVFYRLSNQ